MQEKMTALFRKLELNGKTYYKCDFVVPEFVPNDRFDNLINRLTSNKEQFFITGTEDELNNKGIRPNIIFYEEKGLHVLLDKDEKELVSSKFGEITSIAKKEDKSQPDDLIKMYSDKIYDETKCHRGAIKEIIQTIVLNNDFRNSNIPSRDKYLSHDNIVFFGPMGCGKSLVLEALKNNLDIPTFEMELTDDVELNREMIVENILNNEKEFDGQAVIIVDLDFNKFGQEFEGDAFYPLKELTSSANLCYSPYLKKPVNMREITFITNVNVAETMLEYGDLTNYFMHISGCTKAVGTKKLSMFQTRKVLYESKYSKLKLCEALAKKYGRSFSVDNKAMASIIKLSEAYDGNIMMIDAAILDSFKEQLNKGYKKIIIGERTLEIFVGILRSERQNLSFDDEDIEKELNDDKDEEIEVDEIDLSDALANKEKAVEDLVKQIKKVIKGQDAQIKDLATIILDNQEVAHDEKDKDPENNKVNVLIRGGSGTGKTEIIRIIAKTLGIPIIVEDSTRYTEEGYVGESVTNMLLHLYRETGEDREKAERGIIVIDEIDKKANNDNSRSDVSRTAVQDALLKMIEGETYQLEYKKAVPQGNIIENVTFDTRRLTFIGLGAFKGLDEVKDARIKKATKPKSMGFKSNQEIQEREKELAAIDRNISNEDYVEYGFTDQFIGRFDEKIYLNNINRDTMIDIMKNGAKSPFVAMKKKYARYGIEVEFTEDFYERLADRALLKKSGARSIKEVFGDLKQYIHFNDIKKSKYSKIIFNGNCFDDANALVLIEKENNKQLVK